MTDWLSLIRIRALLLPVKGSLVESVKSILLLLFTSMSLISSSFSYMPSTRFTVVTIAAKVCATVTEAPPIALAYSPVQATARR